MFSVMAVNPLSRAVSMPSASQALHKVPGEPVGNRSMFVDWSRHSGLWLSGDSNFHIGEETRKIFHG